MTGGVWRHGKCYKFKLKVSVVFSCCSKLQILGEYAETAECRRLDSLEQLHWRLPSAWCSTINNFTTLITAFIALVNEG